MFCFNRSYDLAMNYKYIPILYILLAKQTFEAWDFLRTSQILFPKKFIYTAN